MSGRRRMGLVLASGALLLAAGAALGGLLWSAGLEQLRDDLARARDARLDGRPATAQKTLSALLERWPDRPEVLHEFGLCAQLLGRPDEAIAAWERIPPDTPEGVLAAADLGTLLTNRGRFGPAERALRSALPFAGGDTPGSHELLRALSRIDRLQGRVADVRRVLRESWEFNPPADRPELLKELWLLDTTPFPIEGLRTTLGQVDPEDDRVWLARANLELLDGRPDEARRWIEACLEARPDDPAAWRAELERAQAVGDVPDALDALRHLPADAISGTDALELRAWLASRTGDRDTERQALARILDRHPGHPAALERLAELAARSGDEAEATRLRRLKAEVDRNRDRYRVLLLTLSDLAAEADTLAKLSEAIGRRFDAFGWRTLGGGPPPPDETLDLPLADSGPAIDLVVDLIGPHPGGNSANELDSTPTPPRFVDIAGSAGLHFTFDAGHSAVRHLPETMSGGIGLLDYDVDGWLDIYCVQGGPFPPRTTDRPSPGDRLFRNLGDGTFADVTESAGLPKGSQGYGHGVAVGDIDDDGDPDLFVTQWRSYALLLNNGDGTFTEITTDSGLGGDRDWPTSAAFADLDADGDLDLYVCHYLEWYEQDPPLCQDDTGAYFYCDPVRLHPLADHLFRNDGGTFVDVTAGSGLDVAEPGRSLGVVANDLDGDGWVDLYVANDGTANFLFRNLGGMRFEEIGAEAGVAGNAEGGFQAGMGLACGDVDGDTLPDLAVTNFYGEGTTLYRNLGGGFFVDHSSDLGLTAATRHVLGFGLSFLDYDNDGRLDLLQVNGHVNDGRPNYPYHLPSQLLANLGDGRLVDATRSAGPPWSIPRLSRGLTVGDLDNDGRPDAVVLSQNEPVALYSNRTDAGHFLTLELEGTTSNRDAVGARVTVTSRGRPQVAWKVGGGSYQSANSARLHFGLGDDASPVDVEVYWPDGRSDRFEGLAPGLAYRLVEGESDARPREGWGDPRRSKPE